MFTSTGLFKGLPCPLGSDCLLVNCMFSHQTMKKHANGEGDDNIYDPSPVVERPSPPPSKRRRLEDTVKPKAHPSQVNTEPFGKKSSEKAQTNSRPCEAGGALLPGTSRERPKSGVDQPTEEKFLSAQKSVSPPPLRRAAAAPVPGKVKESLNPRTIPHPPQKHPKRKAILTALHAAMVKLNDQTSSLSSDELIAMANDEEEQMALTSRDEDSYRTITGQRVMKLRKMELTQWKDLVLEHVKRIRVKDTRVKQRDHSSTSPSTPGLLSQGSMQPSISREPRAQMVERPSGELKKPDNSQSAFSLGLTLEQEIALLHHIQTPVEGLADYVTTPPPESEIAKAKMGLQTAAGQEVCDRCRSRFTVFPGRNEAGKLTSGGLCHYHWAKLPKFAADATYECCGNGAGSEPCSTAPSHVFKVTDPKRLASIWQFEKTPEQSEEPLARAISIDCEMGYTTLGMEMIRLSALSWPEAEELIDVLVRPIGEVLDLNTRFSGVSLDQFNKATPYRTKAVEDADSASQDGERKSGLMKVESPAAARKLLFDKIGRNTALIGHAIDNDLNVLRVIHPFIVDTVLLYPHPRGLPARYSLKMLTNKYLSRNIQDRQTGHDSNEDAKATGELVRLKVHERWKKMRGEGWTFKQDSLIPPAEPELAPKTSLRPRAI
jgi:hypothetical protein